MTAGGSSSSRTPPSSEWGEGGAEGTRGCRTRGGTTRGGAGRWAFLTGLCVRPPSSLRPPGDGSGGPSIRTPPAPSLAAGSPSGPLQ